MKTLEERIKATGQSIIDNAAKIAESYDGRQTDLDIHIWFRDDGISPTIEVSKEFIPKGMLHD
jgi:hypothetical protein